MFVFVSPKKWMNFRPLSPELNCFGSEITPLSDILQKFFQFRVDRRPKHLVYLLLLAIGLLEYNNLFLSNDLRRSAVAKDFGEGCSVPIPNLFLCIGFFWPQHQADKKQKTKSATILADRYISVGKNLHLVIMKMIIKIVFVRPGP